MRNQNTFGDKLMLFALARIFQRHVVVYGKNRCWCTIGTDKPINGDRLLKICQVHLVYIGENMYGELRRKPFASKRPQFMSAAPVYDTGEVDTSNNKTAALNLSQSAVIDINKEDGKHVPSHVHDHDYSKNGDNRRVTDSAEIPEFPEFANIGGSSSNSSPSPCDQPTSPTSPSSEIQSPAKQQTKTVSTDSDYDSDDTINYPPCETIQNNTGNGDDIDNALLATNDQSSVTVQVESENINSDKNMNATLRGINDCSLSDAMDVLGINKVNSNKNLISVNNRSANNTRGINECPTDNTSTMNGINTGNERDITGLNRAPVTGDNSKTDPKGINISGANSDNTGSMSINTETDLNDSSSKSEDTDSNNFVKNPVTHVHNLWKKDAVQRTWTVDVPKLSKTRLYELTHPPPNWDQIDPYSSLEETVDNEDECNPPPEETSNVNSSCYVLRERKLQNVKSSSRTRRVTSTMVSYKENSGSDSDYTPKPKRAKPLKNLREPSKDRLAAQRNVVLNRKDQGLPSIVDATNTTVTDNDPSVQVNAEKIEAPSSVDTLNPKSEIKNNKQDVKPVPDYTVMSSIHPRG